MSYKRIYCIITAVIMLFLCSCGKNLNEPTVPDNISADDSVKYKQFTLAYCASDSLNPYAAATELNRNLGKLIFDPLVKLNTEFQPVYVLAKEITLTGKTASVSLVDTTFSDGSAVTAQDVVYSFKLAQGSSLNYAVELSEVKSCTAKDGSTVSFTLTREDPYFASILDFPIIKAGSEKQTDDNHIPLAPIGSGRYVFDRETGILNLNPLNHRENISVTEIKLINTPDSEVITHNLETGSVSIYYSDLSDGVIPPMVGTATPVMLNNLVFIGVNRNKSYLEDVGMRYALSYAVDRTAVCRDSYFSYATPAAGIFNPLWDDAKGLQNIPDSNNNQNVVANLSALGYNIKDTDVFYTDANGKELALTLVAYSENEVRLAAAKLIAEQMKSAGIRMTVKSLGWDDYVAALITGNFDLYLAEVRIPGNMDISELVTEAGALNYGKKTSVPALPKINTPAEISPNNETPDDGGDYTETEPTGLSLEDAVKGFYGGELSLTDIINSFNADFPLIPVCYRSGITVCDAAWIAGNISSVSDIYFGMSNINLKQ